MSDESQVSSFQPPAPSPLPYVDVIVVFWKSAPYLEALFDGLVTLNYPHDRLTVHFVDNGPGDGSLDEARTQMLRLEGRLPPIEIHEPGKNTGFSGGNNLAMRLSIERGHAYSYLLNHDATFEPDALREIVAVAERESNAGSLQSLLVLQQNPDEINSTGNAIHFLGFGYCMGYHRPRAEAPRDVQRIAFASGAGVLYRNSVLQEVGMLDETLFAYHEDLDLGWRMMLAGHRNLLVPSSVVRHRYEFSRSIAKWYWMERNRDAVVLKNYHILTVLLLLPALIGIDVILLLYGIVNGWSREKLGALGWFFFPSTWRYIIRGRREIARIRRVPDRSILETFTPVIAYQEFESGFMTRIANPITRLVFAMLKFIVRW